MADSGAIDRELKALGDFFERDGWTIEERYETGLRRVVEAVMSSGYGSGPAVVNLTELAEHLRGARNG